MEEDAEQDEPEAEADERRGELERLGPAREPPGRGAAPRAVAHGEMPRRVAEAGERACREDDRADEQKAAGDGALRGEPCGARRRRARPSAVNAASASAASARSRSPRAITAAASRRRAADRGRRLTTLVLT